jgi:hypothetical protein
VPGAAGAALFGTSPRRSLSSESPIGRAARPKCGATDSAIPDVRVSDALGAVATQGRAEGESEGRLSSAEGERMVRASATGNATSKGDSDDQPGSGEQSANNSKQWLDRRGALQPAS